MYTAEQQLLIDVSDELILLAIAGAVLITIGFVLWAAYIQRRGR